MSQRLTLLAWTVVVSLVSVSVADEAFVTSDYTCEPRFDYEKPKQPGTCPFEKIQNGVCDNPNHGGDDDSCIEQDCIDCNKFCQGFNADCFGCLNAVGCYYCPGDATCQNSDLYQSSIKKLSCNETDDFWLGGRDNPDDLCISADSLTSDPLSLTNNWVYKMINVDKVWSELQYTGEGVTIRINDLGVDVNNDDFQGRFDLANSCENFEPQVSDDGSRNSHGTRVAGVIVGNANNNHCAAGIAYGSRFTSCNVMGLSYAGFNEKIESIDISQNSIQVQPCYDGGAVTGLEDCPFDAPTDEFNDPCDVAVCDFANQATTALTSDCENAIFRHCERNYRDDVSTCLDFIEILLGDSTCDYDRLPKSAIDAIAEGATLGREGKGIIYVFASGNGFYTGEDVNFSRWPNSRYTITVGAVGKDELHADYSTPGAALTVVGPAGDTNDVQHIMTTGLDNTCQNSGRGTSFSSPVVSGVIALMLEARPELTWRDVQGILAETSTVTNDAKDTTKTTNAAGFTHSNWYGFGLIDAKKAVDTALTWTLFTPEYQAFGQSAEENQPIPNNGTEYVSELTMSSDYIGFTAESTVVLINLQHYNRGDLELTLVSPAGTESILHPGRRPENNQPKGDERWKLMTVRNWGEDPSGKWQLKMKDLETGNTPFNGLNELRQWKIVVYGRTADGLPPVLSTQAPSGTPSLGATTTSPSFTIDTSMVPSKSPTPTASPTSLPTSSPTSSPTLVPTITPGRLTLPPHMLVRPTVLVKGFEPQVRARSSNTGVARPLQAKLPTRSDPLGGSVVRPVFIVGGNPAHSESGSALSGLVTTFTKFREDDESKVGSNVLIKLVQNVSLVFEGVDHQISDESWTSIQTALEEHTMAVVDETIPELDLLSEIHLTSVTVIKNEQSRHHMKSLQPENGPFVTIMFDTMIRFDELAWTGELRGIDLVRLPFQDSKVREEFMNKLRNELDKDEHPWLEHLVNVSPLLLPPTVDGSLLETPIVFSSESNNQRVSGKNNGSFGPTSKTISVVWSIGVGILCVTLIFVLRRRRVEDSGGKLEVHSGVSLSSGI